jgi:hypothetical protein
MTEEEKDRALVFVKHIENHFSDPRLVRAFGFNSETEVMCKICNKTLAQIYEETRA